MKLLKNLSDLYLLYLTRKNKLERHDKLGPKRNQYYKVDSKILSPF